DKLLLGRSELVLRSGVSAPDMVFLTFSCPRCGRFLDDRLERPATSPAYRDLKGLIASAQAQAARELIAATQEAPACSHCELPGTAISLDYHTFRGATGKDLVVRCFKKKGLFSRGRHELLWCDLTTQETLPVEELVHAQTAVEAREEEVKFTPPP